MNYDPGVLTLFRQSRHAGWLPHAGQGHAGARGRGPEVLFSARAQAGKIVAMRFGALACPHVLAACEWVCRQAEGREPAWLAAVTAADLSAAVSAPVEKTGSLLVVEDALRELASSLADSVTD